MNQTVSPAARTAGAPLQSSESAALSLRNVSKSYGANAALKDASLRFYPGEIHAIIGENGAGKSTLISVVAGVTPRSSGEILLNGVPLDPRESVAGIRKLGVSVVFQHPALLPDLTVLENLKLVAPDLSGQTGRARAEALIESVATEHLRVALNDRVDSLTLARKHVVEIVRALATNPKILFLDEPTEPFQAQDVDKLFALLARLKASGVAIIYVSHRLHEMQKIADRISIIRDGEVIGTRIAAEVTTQEIVTLIAGRPIDQVFPPKNAQPGAALLSVNNLSGADFADISLTVASGEIVGLTGVEGQGQREFIRALAGLYPPASGSVTLAGMPVAPGIANARAAGIVFVPDDRQAEGLFTKLSIESNVSAGLLPALSQWGFMRHPAERQAAKDVISTMQVRAEGTGATIASLSGGNQQKVLLGREIATKPKILLADEPTKGVDIGARSEIYQKLRNLAAAGAGVVVAASDGIELEGLCDRVLVFARGSVAESLTGDQVTDHRITDANLSAKILREESAAPAQIRRGVGRLFRGDHFPIAILAILAAAIIIGTNVQSPYFLTAISIQNMLTFMAVLILVCLAQLTVMVAGGIDLSVGPLMGLVVVLASLFMQDGLSSASLILWGGLILAGCTLYGLAQGLLIVLLRLPPITATLGTFVGLQGVSLLLRPTPGGVIAAELANFFSAAPLGVPVAAWLALAVALAMEFALLRTGFGRRLRAVGSAPEQCRRIGVKAPAMVVFSFVVSGLLSGIAGLILAGQIGMGTASAGVDYALMSITAVVLGGASVAGGRGSFLATLAGAVLIQSTISASSFLQANTALQYVIVGGLTLTAAGIFSLVRYKRAAR